MAFEQATRLKKLPPYLFAEIEEKVRVKKNEGLDIIDFGIGDPDLPTPSPIIEEIKKQLDDPENHRYPSSSGELDARKAVADWYERRFGVHLDPNGQVAILIGSKEGLANICRAFVNPGEKVLCPGHSLSGLCPGCGHVIRRRPGPIPVAGGEQIPARP